jgi:hypothetical protein
MVNSGVSAASRFVTRSSMSSSERPARRHGCLGAVLTSCLVVTGIAVAPASGATTATSVTTPTVTLAPTAAAGARTGYTVVFNTSASGALVGGGTVTLVFPTGTNLSTLTSTLLTDVTTATAVGQANPSATTSLTFTIYGGRTVNAGHKLSASLQGVVNPTTVSSTDKVSVQTSADTTPVLSTSYSIVAGHAVTTPTATLAPTAAAGARTGYTVVFATSSTGGLSGNSGGTVTLVFPTGTVLSALTSTLLTDTTTATAVGQANPSTTTSLTFNVYGGKTINPGDTLSASIQGVLNPTTVSVTNKVSVKTSSDLTAVLSTSYAVVAGHSVTTPTVTLAPTAVAGARTGYTVVFATSSTGGVSGNSGGTVTLVFPTGTVLSALTSTLLTDTTTATAVGQANPSTTTTLTFNIYGGKTVNPGDTLSASIQGVGNPTTVSSTNKVSVKTSSDLTAVLSTSYAIVAGHAVTTPAVALSPTAAAGARTGYTVVFKVSSTGGLSGNSGGKVTLVFPTGTVLSTLTSTLLTDTTTATAVGQANPSTTTTLTFNIYGGKTVNPGDNLSASVQGVVNPTAVSSIDKVSVKTTSDTPAVLSANFAVVAGHYVSTPSVTPSSHVAGATGVTYTVKFTTSTTGGLAGNAGSKVTMGFPAGTNLSHITGAVLTDTTAGIQVGFANVSASTTLTFLLNAGKTVPASHLVTATFNAAVNPTTVSNTDTVSLTTTSDITSRTSCPYYIGAGPAAPCVLSLTPKSGPAGGGTTVTITGSGFTGATAVKFGTAAATSVVINGTGTSLTARAPAGTGTVNVTVTTPAGTSPTGPVARYTYVPPPTVTTTSLPSGAHGVAYSATLTASGGKSPYSWAIVSGALPAGLTLTAATGVISGTPTTAGTSSFTVRVTDSESPVATGTKALSITVT